MKSHGQIENWLRDDATHGAFLGTIFQFCSTSKSYYFHTIWQDKGKTMQAVYSQFFLSIILSSLSCVVLLRKLIKIGYLFCLRFLFPSLRLRLSAASCSLCVTVD